MVAGEESKVISVHHRFHGHGSLQYLHNRASIVRGQGMSLKYIANPKRSSYRAAVVVSKKVHKSAVVRNRIRRRLYEIIRLSLDPAIAYDFAIMVYDESVAAMPAAQLEQRVASLLAKAKQVKVGKVTSS